MLTLQEVKQMVEIPDVGKKIPTAKQLRSTGTVLISRQLNTETEIEVYPNGYALYRLGRYKTVFSVHDCGDYCYQSSGSELRIEEAFFNRQEWYVRMVLEGEDRVISNREVWEREKCIFCGAISETGIVSGYTQSPLERLVQMETLEELMSLLTERQRLVVHQFFLCQKSQKEIAKELGIASPVVSQTIKRAIRRIGRQYPDMPVKYSETAMGEGKGGDFHAW